MVKGCLGHISSGFIQARAGCRYSAFKVLYIAT
jgi:hypothetical protein